MNNSKRPEFSPRTADPNVMTSTDFSFVWKHWYASIKVTALYLIFTILTRSFSVPWYIFLVLSLILMVVWVYFDYTDIYKLAMRDYNLVKYEYLTYDEKRGLKNGLQAQIPGLICVILMCVLSLGSGTWSDLFRVLWWALYSPFGSIIGLIQDQMANTSVWAIAPFFLIPLAVQPVVGYLAYKNGYHNIGILNKIIYRSRDKDKRLR